MLERLKWLIAGRELRALERYRVACAEVQRWNAGIPDSANTAQWISGVGEGERAFNIAQFRDYLRRP